MAEHTGLPVELFRPEEVERGRRYHRPLYPALALDVGLFLGVLSALAFGGVGDRLHGLVDGAPWWLEAPAFTALCVLATTVVRLPLGWWRGFLRERRWELSTQTFRGWAGDVLRGYAVSAVLLGLVLTGFVALARWVDAWPVVAAAAAAAFALLLGFVAPVVLEPVFNRFRPLADETLASSIRALAVRAGAPVRDVLVADASRRTRKLNAYVSGFGRTRRVVLFDTLVEQAARGEIEAVAAHELGHRRHRHVEILTVLAMAGSAIAVLVLWLATESTAVLDAVGASGAGDPRIVPLVLLVAGALQLLAAPGGAALARRFERVADREALELTRDPASVEAVFRRLASENVSDLDPPRLVRWLLLTHPPLPERILAARTFIPFAEGRALRGGNFTSG